MRHKDRHHASSATKTVRNPSLGIPIYRYRSRREHGLTFGLIVGISPQGAQILYTLRDTFHRLPIRAGLTIINGEITRDVTIRIRRRLANIHP